MTRTISSSKAVRYPSGATDTDWRVASDRAIFLRIAVTGFSEPRGSRGIAGTWRPGIAGGGTATGRENEGGGAATGRENEGGGAATGRENEGGGGKFLDELKSAMGTAGIGGGGGGGAAPAPEPGDLSVSAVGGTLPNFSRQL
jgi:hypothetical protein